MEGTAETIELVFDPEDMVDRTQVATLIDDLAKAGTRAEISKEYDAAGVLPLAIIGIVGLIAPTAAGLAVTAAFIYRVFRCAVVLDLRGARPKVSKERDLPRGSLLILWADGTQELREGISDDAIGKAIGAVVAAGGKK